MKTRKQLTLTLLIIFGIIILVDIISVAVHHRFDTTEDKEYTLSKATKNMLAGLEEPVTITAYFTEDLPPQYSKVRKEFKDLINEYASASKGMIAYKFVDPSQSNNLEKAAMDDGIRPVLVGIRDKDKAEQLKAYMGAVVKFGTKQEIIPIIQNETPIEYTLSTCIKKLTIKNKPTIGFVQGHGEITLQSLGQTINEIGFLYNIENVVLTDSVTGNVDLSKYTTLIINSPKQQFSGAELAKLDEFLALGGKLLINLDHVGADLQQTMQMNVVTTGLEGWLTEKGLVIEDHVVIDKHCGNIGVVQQQGAFSMTVPMAFPYLPIISKFAEHPITESLKGLTMTFASTMQFTGSGNIEFTPLMFTSDASGIQSLPSTVNIQKKWTDSDFTSANLIVAGVLTGNFNSGPTTSIVVIGDGDFAAGQGNQRVNADNVNLLANSIDWLSDDTGLIELRSKGITYRPLDELTDNKKATLKWVNFLLPIILIIIYGIINLQFRRIKRNKRTEENYVQ